MRRIVTAAMAALVVVIVAGTAGAAKYDEGTLVGTWEFDMVKMYQDALEAAGQELPPGMSIEAMVKDSYMRITFAKDGTYAFETKTMGGENSESGKWEVVEKTDDTLTLKSTDDGGKAQTIAITFIDKDNFNATVSDGQEEMVMSATRAKGKKVDKEKKAE